MGLEEELKGRKMVIGFDQYALGCMQEALNIINDVKIDRLSQIIHSPGLHTCVHWDVHHHTYAHAPRMCIYTSHKSKNENLKEKNEEQF